MEHDKVYIEMLEEEKQTLTGYLCKSENRINKLNQENDEMQHEINMLREKCGQVPAKEDRIKPSYYHKGKVDTIEFCIENKLGFCEGNIVKYIVRYADKNGMEDLLKVKEYLDRIIKSEEVKANE